MATTSSERASDDAAFAFARMWSEGEQRMRDVDVPEAVRLKAMFQGVEGRRWLAGLGRIIRELERKWGVAVGPALGGPSGSPKKKPKS